MPPLIPAHVVGADGGTINNGDALARANRAAVQAFMPDFNTYADAFFNAPVGPAFPPGLTPTNFNTNAAPMVPMGVAFAPPALAPPAPARRNTTTAGGTGTTQPPTRAGPPPRPARPAAAAPNARSAARPAAATAAARRPPAAAARGTGTVQQQIDEAMRNNMAEKEKGAPKKYRLNYDRYCKHVKEKGIATGRPYISVPGVEHYFSNVVAKEGSVQPDTANCRLTSLVWYADIEHPGTAIDLRTPAVLNSLKLQKQAYTTYQQTQSTKSPHHKLPTNTLTPTDFIDMMEYGYRDEGCSSSTDFAFTMCGGNFCLMRMDSMRKLKLSTLICDTCHGPERTGLASEMVGFILLKGTQKTPGQGTRVAGAWPHRDFRRCTELFLGAMLLSGLQVEPEGFSFLDDGAGNFSWREYPVVQAWRDASSAETAYKGVSSSCDVDWKHVVHLRSAGIEEASTWAGLTPDEISTLSKHWGGNADRLRSSYISELSRVVLVSMSGFGGDVRGSDGITDWYVPECYLDVELDFPGFVDRLFPLRNQWIQDTTEPGGDKDPCATNFLHHLLPHLALRLAQRGIYLIQWAPNHPVSRLLMKAMGPMYSRWAASNRIKCDRLREAHDIKLGLKHDLGGTLHALSAQGQATASRLDRHEKMRKADRRLIKEVRAQNQAILANQVKIMEHFAGASRSTRNSPLASLKPSLPSNSSSDEDDDGSDDDEQEVQAVPAAAGRSASDAGTSSASTAGDAGSTGNTNTTVPAQPVLLRHVLYDRAHPPHVPLSFPKSALQLLKEHNQGNLNTYKLADKKSWDQKLQQRYGKRQRFFQEIEAKAGQLRSPSDIPSRMRRAAEEMDKEKSNLGMTLVQYSDHIRSGKMKRRKKRKADGI